MGFYYRFIVDYVLIKENLKCYVSVDKIGIAEVLIGFGLIVSTERVVGI